MSKEEVHLSDMELLQNLDGELHGSRATAVRVHLESCWQCRMQQSQIESGIAEFMEIHRGSVELPPDGPSRNVFKTRLAQLKETTRPGFRERAIQFAWLIRSHAYVVFLLVATLSVGVAIHVLMPGVHAASIPNARLTPGVVRAVTREDLCASAQVEGAHPVPDRLAFRVFNKYGIHDPQPRTYEVDYLITPALGGSDDVRNLWPEPYAEGVWNAHVKDALEDRLHELVCSGKLDLATAQHDIAANWIEAYKKYFHAERPLELHAGFSKDPPWE